MINSTKCVTKACKSAFYRLEYGWNHSIAGRPTMPAIKCARRLAQCVMMLAEQYATTSRLSHTRVFHRSQLNWVGLPVYQTLEPLQGHAHTSTSCALQCQHQILHQVYHGPTVSNEHTLCSELATCRQCPIKQQRSILNLQYTIHHPHGLCHCHA